MAALLVLTERLAVGLLSVTGGLVPQLPAALGVNAPALRAAALYSG